MIPEAPPRGLKREVDDPHTLAANAVAAIVGVDPRVGLTSSDALGRAADVGSNALAAPDPPRPWRLVLQSARQPFVLLLLVAGVAAALIGEVRDGLLILAGLVPLVGADVATEYRGEQALQALRAASAPRAQVRRDGRVTDLAAADLVPGDMVLLRVGDVVPADLRLCRAERLVLDRSVLTGESIPETMAVEPDPPWHRRCRPTIDGLLGHERGRWPRRGDRRCDRARRRRSARSPRA